MSLTHSEEQPPDSIRERIALVEERARRFRATPHLDAHMRTFLEDIGSSDEEWCWLLEHDPEAAFRIRKAAEEKFQFALIFVHDKMLQAALEGNTAAMKLYMQRFDKEFVERKETRLSDEGGLPSYEDFEALMILKLGHEKWDLLKTAAEKAGMPGGICGEEYLPGGRLAEEEIIDVEGTVSAPPDTIAPATGSDLFDEIL